MARCRVSKWVFLLEKIFWNEWKKKGIKVKKQTDVRLYVFLLSFLYRYCRRRLA